MQQTTNYCFSSFPILTSERLTLRQLTVADKHRIYKLRSDAAINKYLDRKPCNDIDDSTAFINAVNDNFNKKNCFYWGIILTNTNTVIGTICLFNFVEEDGQCEIGYELLPEFQKQGIMIEAAEQVVSFVFNTLKLNKIEACSHIENLNSTALLKKLNFVKQKDDSEKLNNVELYILMKE